MKENIALLLAILYLIYRYKTYSKVNKIIECSKEDAEKVGLALDKYFVPLESEFYKIDDNTYSFVNAGGLKGTFSINQNYDLLALEYNGVNLLALH